MNSDTQEQLLEIFMQAAGSQPQATEPLASAGQEVADSMRGIAEQVSGYSNTHASQSAGAATQSSGPDALSIAKTVFESGLGVIPLVTGLIGLFGGGGSDTPPPLTKYAMPDKIYFEGADTGSGISGSSYDQMGNPRPYAPAPVAPMSSPSPQAPQQITVNVQAMDSRSFLDHSSDIARAVRDAMLNMNPLNDVVNNL
jgi:hypothetical protein